MHFSISLNLKRDTMVSIVLLTTDEVLQRNGFWYCLDSLWVVEELEPFEEVKPEHAYSKPLSKDVYYTKFPDIPRSESEEENSLSLSGFKTKHREWKSKICIRRFDAQRKTSLSSSLRSANSNNSLNNKSRRVTSLVELSQVNQSAIMHTSHGQTDDEKIRSFFDRLIANIPPPPLTELQENNASFTELSKIEKHFEDIDLPDYADFEKDKMLQINPELQQEPGTSTLKKVKRKVSFKLDPRHNKSDFEQSEFWYDSIYGVSDIITSSVKESSDEGESSDFLNEVCEMEYDELSDELMQNCNNNYSSNVPSDSEHVASWSEIMTYCGVNDTILRSEESLRSIEDIISRSHCADAKIFDCIYDDDNEEVGYARFAVYKIHQTLKLEDGMTDSSSMKDFGGEEDYAECNIASDSLSYANIYRLAPVDDVDDSVNVAWN